MPDKILVPTTTIWDLGQHLEGIDDARTKEFIVQLYQQFNKLAIAINHNADADEYTFGTEVLTNKSWNGENVYRWVVDLSGKLPSNAGAFQTVEIPTGMPDDNSWKMLSLQCSIAPAAGGPLGYSIGSLAPISPTGKGVEMELSRAVPAYAGAPVLPIQPCLHMYNFNRTDFSGPTWFGAAIIEYLKV
jgi:hypothetical protein